MWHYFNPYLMALYRVTGIESMDGLIGTFLVALLVVVIGEFTISMVFQINRKHLDRLNENLKNYSELSQEALRLGDEVSYKALNKQANDAYGHVFFNKFGLSALIGLDYPVLLAVIGALAWLIPWFGGVIAVIPALVVGLASGIVPGILAAIYTVGVLVVMEYIVEPRIFWRKNYSSVILVLVVLVLVEANGLIGLIVAPLASAVIQIVFKYLLHPDTSYEAPDVNLDDEEPILLTSSLMERLAETRDALHAQGENPAPEIVSWMQRLENLIFRASQTLDSSTTEEQA